MGQFKAIFKRAGKGYSWDEGQCKGNPAYSGSVADYLKVLRAEHSEAHVVPKQAKPIFLRVITNYFTCPLWCILCKTKAGLRTLKVATRVVRVRATWRLRFSRAVYKRSEQNEQGYNICRVKTKMKGQ